MWVHSRNQPDNIYDISTFFKGIVMLYLVRHGESEANIQKRYTGITDVDLSNKGKVQAEAAGKRLASEKISGVYSSPLKRARETAEIICRETNFNESKIIIMDCLMEVNFGLFENMTWNEIESDYKEESEKWILSGHKYKFPKGEGYEDIIKRIAMFIDHVPDNSLIVTHFGVVQSILIYLGIANDMNLWNFTISNGDIMAINNKTIAEHWVNNC